jgi:hypothetical protein
MIRVAWAFLTGAIVVATRDFDGAVRYRIARKTPFGHLTCRAIMESVTLLPGGKTSGACYVHEWVQVWPRPTSDSAGALP